MILSLRHVVRFLCLLHFARLWVCVRDKICIGSKFPIMKFVFLFRLKRLLGHWLYWDMLGKSANRHLVALTIG